MEQFFLNENILDAIIASSVKFRIPDKASFHFVLHLKWLSYGCEPANALQ